jgi:hypothetical protein
LEADDPFIVEISEFKNELDIPQANYGGPFTFEGTLFMLEAL